MGPSGSGNVDPNQEEQEPIDAIPLSYAFPHDPNAVYTMNGNPINARPVSFMFPTGPNPDQPQYLYPQDPNAQEFLGVHNGLFQLLRRPTPPPVEPETPLPESSQRQKRALSKSNVVMEFDIDFKLTEAEIEHLQLLDTVRLSQKTTDSETANTESSNFSVSQRLEGWRVEIRQRTTGMQTFDKFFYHKPSKKMFRSLVEVDNFVKYEIYPSQRQTEETSTSVSGAGMSADGEKPIMPEMIFGTPATSHVQNVDSMPKEKEIEVPGTLSSSKDAENISMKQNEIGSSSLGGQVEKVSPKGPETDDKEDDPIWNFLDKKKIEELSLHVEKEHTPSPPKHVEETQQTTEKEMSRLNINDQELPLSSSRVQKSPGKPVDYSLEDNQTSVAEAVNNDDWNVLGEEWKQKKSVPRSPIR